MGLFQSDSQHAARIPASNAPAVDFTAFDVSKVDLAKTALPEVPYYEAVGSLLTEPSPMIWFDEMIPGDPIQWVSSVESCSRYHGKLVAEVYFHPVLAAIHLAFMDHRPLVLSPDMIWLLVAQGFANHVNANSEDLRSQFVQHSGKVSLKVRRDDFIKGSPENPWPEVFAEFSSHIRNHLGASTHDLLMPCFSTTGVVERAAAEVVLLDAMQSFFSYDFCSACGIPQIILEGLTADWELLAERTRGIGEFGLGWWTEVLEPILDQFTAASRGQVNVPFWESLYREGNESGGPYTNGWITAFFPYLKDFRTGCASRKNPWLAKGGTALQELLYSPENSFRVGSGHAPRLTDFPSGIARAPFSWQYHDRSFQMEFLGGFLGVQQDAETLRLRPEIGWAIQEQVAGDQDGPG